MGKPIVTITKKGLLVIINVYVKLLKGLLVIINTTLVFLNNRQRGRVVNSEKNSLIPLDMKFLSFNYVY